MKNFNYYKAKKLQELLDYDSFKQMQGQIGITQRPNPRKKEIFQELFEVMIFNGA